MGLGDKVQVIIIEENTPYNKIVGRKGKIVYEYPHDLVTIMDNKTGKFFHSRKQYLKKL